LSFRGVAVRLGFRLPVEPGSLPTRQAACLPACLAARQFGCLAALLAGLLVLAFACATCPRVQGACSEYYLGRISSAGFRPRIVRPVAVSAHDPCRVCRLDVWVECAVRRHIAECRALRGADFQPCCHDHDLGQLASRDRCAWLIAPVRVPADPAFPRRCIDLYVHGVLCAHITEPLHSVCRYIVGIACAEDHHQHLGDFPSAHALLGSECAVLIP